MIAQYGKSAAAGFAIEFAGPAVESLTMAGRMTLCNVAIEAGARVGMVAPDDVTFDYLAGRPFVRSVGSSFNDAATTCSKSVQDAASVLLRSPVRPLQHQVLDMLAISTQRYPHQQINLKRSNQVGTYITLQKCGTVTRNKQYSSRHCSAAWHPISASCLSVIGRARRRPAGDEDVLVKVLSHHQSGVGVQCRALQLLRGMLEQGYGPSR